MRPTPLGKPPTPCHPERSQVMREAHGLAQSKDPYFLKARNTTSSDAIISAMRTTVALDDDLVRPTQGVHQRSRGSLAHYACNSCSPC
jgi:hypothetical protein